MNRTVRTFGCLAALVSTFTASAAAQTPPAPSPPRPIALSVVGGLISGGSSTGGTIGGTFTLDVSDRLSIETTGTYLDRGRGADGVYGNAGLLVNLLPVGSRVVPYATLGGGVYHVTFDLDEPRIMRPWPLGESGPFPNLGSMSGFRGFGQMPMMYAERLRSMVWPPPPGGYGRRSFTDPVMTIGGGVRLDLTPHLSLRPDARALVVFGDGRSSTLGMFSLGVGYRF